MNKPDLNETEIENLLQEILILKDMDHPNIIKMFEFFEDEKRYFIVTDIINGGKLIDIIHEKGKMMENDVLIIIKNALACMNYCHREGVVHRNLRLAKILLSDPLDFD
jgi:calcium-dependent protein kinase